MPMEQSTSVNTGAADTPVRRKKKVRIHEKRITLRWFLVIVAAAILVSVSFVTLRGCILSLSSMEETQYRPLDIERKYQEVIKYRDEDEKAKGSNSGK
jgi:hypothetical protein